MRWLLLYLSIRYWLRHRGAFILASLGVALGVAVFVAVQVANTSVLGAFSASLDAVTGKANLQIRGGPGGLPERLFTRIAERDDPRIKAAAPVISRTVLAPKLKTSILIQGVDLFSEAALRDFTPGEGETPANGSTTQSMAVRFLMDPHALAISESLASRHGLKPGSSLDLTIGAKREKFIVAAVLPTAATGRIFGGDYGVMDIAAAQEFIGEIGRISRIELLVDESQVDAVGADLRHWAPPDATVGRPAQRNAQIATMLGAFQLNLTALSSIALFVGAFLIYNAMASAVTRRRAEAGILRAVGAGRGQITGLFVLEAGAIGLFGSVCGLLLGIVLAHWTLGAVATTVSKLYLSVRARELFVSPWILWASPLAGTLLAMLAAWPAAREASGTSPRAAFTGLTLHRGTERIAPWLALGGLAMLAVAAVLCRPEISGHSPMAGFAAAGATLGGFAAFAPWLTLHCGRVLRPLAGRAGGIAGALAVDDLRRALNRSSLAVAALSTSLALTIGMNVMVYSFRATVVEWIGNTISADLFIAPSNGFDGERTAGIPPEVLHFAGQYPDLSQLDTLRVAEVETHGQPISILANTLPSLRTGQRRLHFVSTERGAGAAVADFLDGGRILVSERVANLLNLKPGGVLSLPTPAGNQDFLIGGIFYDYNPTGVLYMNKGVYSRLWNDHAVDGLALYLKPGSNVDTLLTELRARFGAEYALTLLPNRQIRQEVMQTFDQTFAVTYALQLIALVVAAVGVFDTLVALLLERQAEIASLRAMGASRGQIRAMNLWEFGLMGLLAWALSVASGLLLAWQMIYVINRQFFGWTIFWKLPPTVLANALLLALAAAFGAGLWPARAAARRDLAALLQRE